jgi:hypothetical protein
LGAHRHGALKPCEPTHPIAWLKHGEPLCTETRVLFGTSDFRGSPGPQLRRCRNTGLNEDCGANLIFVDIDVNNIVDICIDMRENT